MTSPLFGNLTDNFATANVIDVVGFAEEKCVVLPYFVATEPYSSGLHFHNIILITSAVTTVLCLIFTVSLVTVHLSNWVKPHEQKQICRVVLFPTVFSLFNFFSVWFYNHSWWIQPIPEIYETFALVAMFYLIVVYVTPHNSTREQYFHHLARLHAHIHKGTLRHNKGSLRWFRRVWVGVFQVVPVKIIVSAVKWALAATMCPLKYDLSHISWATTVIESVSTSICVMYIILFAQRVAQDGSLEGTNTRWKLISFKTIVGISLTQTPIFQAVAAYGKWRRTIHISVFDFTVGTPAMITCCEMFLVSVIFVWSFSAAPYLNLMASLPRCRGVGGALLDVLDIRDIGKGYWYMTKIIFCCAARPQQEGEGKGLEAGFAPITPESNPIGRDQTHQ